MSAELHQEAIAIRPVTGNSLSEVKALGAVFKASGYFKDVRDEAQAVTKILYGRELGLTPIVSMMGVYIIDGKPSLSANLLAAVIKRSGKYNYRIKENTALKCVIEFKENGEVIGDSEFTMEDAKLARVADKDNWKKYPKAMLFARALSAGARMHCPDVGLCPIYVPEELGASVTEEGDVTELPVTARPVSVTQQDEEIESPRNAAGTDKGPVISTTLNEGDGQSGAASAPESPKVEYCDKGQYSNFWRTLEASCPDGFDPQTYGHDWLSKNGFFDPEKLPEKVPSAKGIPKMNFEQTKAMMKTYFKSLKK